MPSATTTVPVTGVVLAGGQSRRFGRNKATTLLEGRRMIDRVLDVLAPEVSRLLVVANDPEPFPGLEVVPDLMPGTGPLGGLLTALTHASTDWCLVVGCDFPLIEPAVIRLLIERIAGGDRDVVVPRVGGRLQPMQAGYSRRCTSVIVSRIQRGQLKMVDFFPEVRVDFVPTEDFSVVGGSRWSFFNINTPQEYALARCYLRGEADAEPPMLSQGHARRPSGPAKAGGHD